MSALCPACNKEISLPEGAAGKKVKCGNCGMISRIDRGSGGGYALAALGRPRAEAAASAEESEAPAPTSKRSAGQSAGSPRRRTAQAREKKRAHTQVRSTVDADDSRRRARKRGTPGPVIAVAALFCVGGGLSVILALLTLLAAGAVGVSGLDSNVDDEMKAIMLAIWGIGIFLLVLGVGQVIVGIGLLKGSALARTFAIVLMGLSILTNVSLLVLGQKVAPELGPDPTVLVRLGFGAVCMILLFLRPTIEHCSGQGGGERKRGRGRGRSRGSRRRR